jgi:hypothetical protein
MPTNKPKDLGDVHAPVEDTDVPFTLKMLVVIMLVTLVGLGVLIGMIALR